MKKVLFCSFAVFLIFEAIYALAATIQPQKLGSAALQSQTAAQIQALQSNTTGQILYCSDCITNGGAGTVCISTGATAVNQFVLSTGTVCK